MPAHKTWLASLYAGRCGHAMIFSAYSGVLPAVSLAWGMSASQAGAIQSAWHLGFMASLFAVGLFADRFGARITVLRSSQLAALTAMLFALFADSFASAFLLYGLAGLCSGGTYTPALKLIFEEVEAHERGRAMGWYLASGSIGYALSLLLIALLPASLGWRAGILGAALGAVIGSVLLARALAGIENRPAPPHNPRDQAGPLAGFGEVIGNRAAMQCTLAYTAHAWELLGMWAWLPAFVTAAVLAGAGGTAGALAGAGIAIAAVSHLVSAAGSVAGGGLSDRHGRATVMMVATLASLACSFTFGWLYAAPLWLLATVALVYNLAAISDSSVYSTALAETVPARLVGTAYSLRSVLGFTAGAASPWVFGLALDAGRATWGDSTAAWALAWTTLGLGGLAGPLLILAFARETRRHQSAASRNA